MQKFRVCFEIEIVASGETRDEAIENAKKAPSGFLAGAMRDGKAFAIPLPVEVPEKGKDDE